MSIRPILFNTEMVRAILDGRKTCTRRAVKYKYSNTEMKIKSDKYGSRLIEIQKDVEGETYGKNPDGSTWHKLLPYIEKIPPYKKGDILYVRETFIQAAAHTFWYKADDKSWMSKDLLWKPSIHMPKEAARIWLKVTDVRVERLQDITEEQACMEGTDPWDEVCYENNGWHPTFSDPDSGGDPNMVDGFHKLWNSTIKKSDLDRYGWNANPLVWVIEFERCNIQESE